MNKLLTPVAKQKSGYEFFIGKDTELNLCIIDFWRWALSNLTSNETRKMLAEFIVAATLRKNNEARNECDVYGLETNNGKKIEVLSAAYIHTWYNRGLPNISFTMNPTFEWDDEISLQAYERINLVDIFVFCLLHHKNEQTINPMDLSQWTFFVITANQLENILTDKKNITLSELKRLNPIMCGYDNLRRVIDSMASV